MGRKDIEKAQQKADAAQRKVDALKAKAEQKAQAAQRKVDAVKAKADAAMKKAEEERTKAEKEAGRAQFAEQINGSQAELIYLPDPADGKEKETSSESSENKYHLSTGEEYEEKSVSLLSDVDDDQLPEFTPEEETPKMAAPEPSPATNEEKKGARESAKNRLRALKAKVKSPEKTGTAAVVQESPEKTGTAEAQKASEETRNPFRKIKDKRKSRKTEEKGTTPPSTPVALEGVEPGSPAIFDVANISPATTPTQVVVPQQSVAVEVDEDLDKMMAEEAALQNVIETLSVGQNPQEILEKLQARCKEFDDERPAYNLDEVNLGQAVVVENVLRDEYSQVSNLNKALAATNADDAIKQQALKLIAPFEARHREAQQRREALREETKQIAAVIVSNLKELAKFSDEKEKEFNSTSPDQALEVAENALNELRKRQAAIQPLVGKFKTKAGQPMDWGNDGKETGKHYVETVDKHFQVTDERIAKFAGFVASAKENSEYLATADQAIKEIEELKTTLDNMVLSLQARSENLSLNDVKGEIEIAEKARDEFFEKHLKLIELINTKTDKDNSQGKIIFEFNHAISEHIQSMTDLAANIKRKEAFAVLQDVCAKLDQARPENFGNAENQTQATEQHELAKAQQEQAEEAFKVFKDAHGVTKAARALINPFKERLDAAEKQANLRGLSMAIRANLPTLTSTQGLESIHHQSMPSTEPFSVTVSIAEADLFNPEKGEDEDSVYAALNPINVDLKSKGKLHNGGVNGKFHKECGPVWLKEIYTPAFNGKGKTIPFGEAKIVHSAGTLADNGTSYVVLAAAPKAKDSIKTPAGASGGKKRFEPDHYRDAFETYFTGIFDAIRKHNAVNTPLITHLDLPVAGGGIFLAGTDVTKEQVAEAHTAALENVLTRFHKEDKKLQLTIRYRVLASDAYLEPFQGPIEALNQTLAPLNKASESELKNDFSEADAKEKATKAKEQVSVRSSSAEPSLEPSESSEMDSDNVSSLRKRKKPVRKEADPTLNRPQTPVGTQATPPRPALKQLSSDALDGGEASPKKVGFAAGDKSEESSTSTVIGVIVEEEDFSHLYQPPKVTTKEKLFGRIKGFKEKLKKEKEPQIGTPTSVAKATEEQKMEFIGGAGKNTVPIQDAKRPLVLDTPGYKAAAAAAAVIAAEQPLSDGKPSTEELRSIVTSYGPQEGAGPLDHDPKGPVKPAASATPSPATSKKKLRDDASSPEASPFPGKLSNPVFLSSSSVDDLLAEMTGRSSAEQQETRSNVPDDSLFKTLVENFDTQHPEQKPPVPAEIGDFKVSVAPPHPIVDMMTGLYETEQYLEALQAGGLGGDETVASSVKDQEKSQAGGTVVSPENGKDEWAFLDEINAEIAKLDEPESKPDVQIGSKTITPRSGRALPTPRPTEPRPPVAPKGGGREIE